MGRRCSVCDHPDRPPIEIALANDVVLRALSAKYGLKTSALARHRSVHMDEALLVRLRVRGHRSDEDLDRIREVESKNAVDHLSYQRTRFYRIADQCAEVKDALGETRALAQCRAQTELMAKLFGDLSTGPTFNQYNLVMMPDYHRLRTLLARAARTHPSAQQAVMQALQEFEATATPEPQRAAIEHAAA